MLNRIRKWYKKRKRERILTSLFNKIRHLISREILGEDVEEELEKTLQEFDKFWTGVKRRPVLKKEEVNKK